LSTQPFAAMDCAQLNFLHSGDSARCLNESDSNFRTQTRLSALTPEFLCQRGLKQRLRKGTELSSVATISYPGLLFIECIIYIEWIINIFGNLRCYISLVIKYNWSLLVWTPNLKYTIYLTFLVKLYLKYISIVVVLWAYIFQNDEWFIVHIVLNLY